MKARNSPSALRLLWDGIAAVLIGLLLRSMSAESVTLFVTKIAREVLKEMRR